MSGRSHFLCLFVAFVGWMSLQPHLYLTGFKANYFFSCTESVCQLLFHLSVWRHKTRVYGVVSRWQPKAKPSGLKWRSKGRMSGNPKSVKPDISVLKRLTIDQSWEEYLICQKWLKIPWYIHFHVMLQLYTQMKKHSKRAWNFDEAVSSNFLLTLCTWCNAFQKAAHSTMMHVKTPVQLTKK